MPNLSENYVLQKIPTWTDVVVPLVTVSSGGANAPATILVNDNGAASVGVRLPAYTDESVVGNEKEQWFTLQLPHGYVRGSDINLHLHWMSLVAGAGTTNVRWGLEYQVTTTGSFTTNGTFTFVDGGGGEDTITQATGDFTTVFDVGDIIEVYGTTSNDGTYTLTGVAALTLSVATATLTAEAAVASTLYNIQTQPTNTTIVYVDTHALRTAEAIQVTPLVSITGTGLVESSLICGRLFRNSSHANDDHAQTVFPISLDAHIQMDKLGSVIEIPTLYP